MKKIQRYFLVGGILIILSAAFLCAAFRQNLLVHYYSRKVDKQEGNPFYWMRKMVEAGPVGTRRVLELCKNGTYDKDGEVISAYTLMYADDDVYPYVTPLFSDPSAQARAYAASVAGHLRDKRYLPHLDRLAKDETRLPEGWFNKTVAERAKHASGWIRKELPVSEELKGVVEDLTADPEHP